MDTVLIALVLILEGAKCHRDSRVAFPLGFLSEIAGVGLGIVFGRW
jgi:hypothetical protein